MRHDPGHELATLIGRSSQADIPVEDQGQGRIGSLADDDVTAAERLQSADDSKPAPDVLSRMRKRVGQASAGESGSIWESVNVHDEARW